MTHLRDIAWIAVDWGTTNLRAWAMGVDDTPLDQRHSGQGMGTLARDQFEPALLALIAPWLALERTMLVLACGMVGSRQGWCEAGYLEVPCPPPGGADATRPPVADRRIAVHILPGIKQTDPADVMRGEETQIAGLLASDPAFDGLVCLPGTHTKWARVRAGRIESFRSVLTGELFALLSRQSVLRHNVGGEGWDDGAFLAAVEEARAAPGMVTSLLFGVRAASLISGLGPVAARARLSGLLIGLELACVGETGPVTLIGAAQGARPYRQALESLGFVPSGLEANAMTLAGLAACRRYLLEKI